jgi:hypothetical protein
MNARFATFAIVAIGLGVACQSAPPPASPESPGAPGSPGATGSPGSQASGAVGAGADPASNLAAQASIQDLSTCMQYIDPNTTQDCIDCMTGTCATQMKTAGGKCPTFSSCICNAGVMQTCAPMLGKEPACRDAFNAVGACARQSCSSKCTSASAGGAPGPGGGAVPGGQPPGGMQPVTGGPDSCPALKTCCGQLPAPQATQACMKAANKNDPTVCATTLQTFKGMGMCH